MDADNDAADLPLFPAWRQLEKELLANGLTYGSLITDEKLREAFGTGNPNSIADVHRLELLHLGQMDALRDSLLVNRRMLLHRTRRIGYIVVPPEQQTRIAMGNRGREMKHALSKLAREISHINTDKLTVEQRRENADAIAKIGALRGMTRKQLNESSDSP